MKEIAIVISYVVGCLAVVVLLLFGGFWTYRYFAPREEAVRRETFEQSKAYNQGMIQEIQNMEFEYLQAPADGRAALASVILHRVADYDVNKLPADLREFVEKLRAERMGGGL